MQPKQRRTGSDSKFPFSAQSAPNEFRRRVRLDGSRSAKAGWWLAAWALWLGFVLATPATAARQEDPSADGSAQATVENTPESELLQVQGELASLRKRMEEIVAAGASAESLTKPIELLERLESLLSQQLTTLASQKANERDLADTQAQLETQRSAGIAEPPPYAYFFLENLGDQLQAEAQRSERVEEAAKTAREALIRARDDLSAKERARRLVKEEHDANTDESRTEEIGRRLRAAELESRIAAATVTLKELDVELQETNRSLGEVRAQLLQGKLDFIAPRAVLTDGDRATVALDLARQEESLQSLAESAQRALDYLNSQWIDARRRLDQALGGDLILTEEVESLKVGQAYRRAELAALASRLLRVKTERTLWDRRFAIFEQTSEGAQETLWAKESRDALSEIEIETSLISGHLADARNDLVALSGQMSAETTPDLLRWLSRREYFLQALTKSHEEDLASFELLRRLHVKLLDDLGGTEPTFDFRAVGASAWQGVLSVWNYELTHIEDRPITIGKILSGLLLLVFGVSLSKTLSRFLGKRLLPKLKLTEGGLNAFESLVFYVLVVTFALFALRVVNVPLTAFTILGGALAIGFGFGSQNLVNNFISGLILLIERPVRASDLIQVDDLYGTVEHIGLRSTRVRTGSNIEIIVPNSSFLQQNVVNWTLSDNRVRISVNVGVAYGSPTRDVKELLRKATENHGRILKSPEPLVLFANFGDNSLEFEVHFWIRMRNLMDRRIVESDIRFMIDSLFLEAGIVIAFPQRDVHLDSLKPVEIRIVPDKPPEEKPVKKLSDLGVP